MLRLQLQLLLFLILWPHSQRLHFLVHFGDVLSDMVTGEETLLTVGALVLLLLGVAAHVIAVARSRLQHFVADGALVSVTMQR